MRRWHLWVSVAVLIPLIFGTSRDALARLVWQKLDWPRAALLLSREDATLAFEIGNYYFGGGAYDLERAEQAYRKAQALDSSLLGPRYQLARIAFLRRDFGSALATINEELALHPEFKRSYYVRGLIHGHMKNLEAAEKDFQEFLAWDPQSWAAYNDLAWVYFQLGEYEKAREIAATGLRWNPDNTWLLNSMGIALLNLGERTEAKKILERALGEARKLTIANWQKAYPGNHPVDAQKGLASFLVTIKANLALTVDK